ncbi:MAG: PDZ domain-containing protein, partial [Acidocella sp.]|nr:PDZ domain-containing protein [Acidocella sp.]
VVSATGPAARADIAAGDLIEQVDGEGVATAQEVQSRLKALTQAGNPAVLLVSGPLADGTNPGARWVSLRPAG